MKPILIALLVLFFATFAEAHKICKNPVDLDCKEIIKVFNDLKDENHSIKKESYRKQEYSDSLSNVISDNITVKTIQETQQLYNTSFNSLQTSFTIFMLFVTAIIMLGSFLNYKTSNESKKDLKEGIDKFENKILSLEKNLKEQTENQKKEFSNMKNKIETQAKKHDEEYEKVKNEISNLKGNLAQNDESNFVRSVK